MESPRIYNNWLNNSLNDNSEFPCTNDFLNFGKSATEIRKVVPEIHQLVAPIGVGALLLGTASFNWFAVIHLAICHSICMVPYPNVAAEKICRQKGTST
jgi:hypothetical protein